MFNKELLQDTGLTVTAGEYRTDGSMETVVGVRRGLCNEGRIDLCPGREQLNELKGCSERVETEGNGRLTR